MQWEWDRYVLALISIMVPEDQLVTLREALGLPRRVIDQVMSHYTAGSVSNVGERAYVCESCYQMLLRWVGHSQRPEDITYGRLMSALKLTSLGVGAASDATHYLYHFMLDLATARSVPNHA